MKMNECVVTGGVGGYKDKQSVMADIDYPVSTSGASAAGQASKTIVLPQHISDYFDNVPDRNMVAARARAAIVNAEAGSSFTRAYHKVDAVIELLKVVGATTDAIATRHLNIQRSGFMKKLAAAGVLECARLDCPRAILYGLSRATCQIHGVPYINPAKCAGNLEHRLDVQSELIMLLRDLPAHGYDVQLSATKIEQVFGHHAKRPDAYFVLPSGRGIRLEIENSRKSGIELARMVAHIGDANNRGILLVSFKADNVLKFLIGRHVFQAMRKGIVPRIEFNESLRRHVALGERRVGLDDFRGVYVKVHGQPWTLDEKQNLPELYKRWAINQSAMQS